MKYRSTHFTCLLIATLAPFAQGCRDDSLGERVHGRVTFRAEPLTSASLTFFPASGRPVSVVLDSEGEYSVDLPPGEYEVVVSVGVQLPPGFKEGDPLPPPKFELPAKYTVRTNTVLNASVAEGQSEPIDFPLD